MARPATVFRTRLLGPARRLMERASVADGAVWREDASDLSATAFGARLGPQPHASCGSLVREVVHLCAEAAYKGYIRNDCDFRPGLDPRAWVIITSSSM
jgi:hypothetical protein